MDNSAKGFKTAAFGGFNKEDVLKFIEEQKKTEAELRKSVNELTAKINELNESLENSNIEKNIVTAKLLENKDAKEAASALAIKEAEYKALENRYNALAAANDVLSAENEDSIKTVAKLDAQIVDYKNTVSELNARNEELEAIVKEANSNDNLNTSAVSLDTRTGIELQVGAAFVDARRFADQIIAEAENAAGDINEKTVSAIEIAEKKIEIITSELELCAQKCAIFFNEVSAEISAVKSEMGDVKTNIEGKITVTETKRG